MGRSEHEGRYHACLREAHLIADRLKVENKQVAFSTNAIVFGESPEFGEVVIKVSPYRNGDEALTLRKFHEAGGACPEVYLWGADPEWMVMSKLQLANRKITPQEQLGLLSQLHSLSDLNGVPHPSELEEDRTVDWLLPTLDEYGILEPVVSQSVKDLVASSSRSHIIHGDVHDRNFVALEGGGAAMLDPFGLLGDPEQDLAALAWSEDMSADKNIDDWLRFFDDNSQTLDGRLVRMWLGVRMLNSAAVEAWFNGSASPSNRELAQRANNLIMGEH